MAERLLTPAQQRELLDAIRVHPQAYPAGSARVLARLVDLGLAQRVDGGHRLTPAGVDLAAKLGAQRVIDEVAARRTRMRMQSPPAVAPTGPPPGWPFPVSGHRW